MKFFLFVAVLFSLAACQDSSSVNQPATWTGAIASKPVAYSPNKAYNGFAHNTKSKSLQINVASEITAYAKRDTSQHIPFMFGGTYCFVDSLLTAKEQIWLCSLDTHMKYKMRQWTVLDSLCK
jgi:hypothetical protein